MQKHEKSFKKCKNVKKCFWAEMARQSIENKAPGEGARRPPMHRTRFLDQIRLKMMISGGQKIVKKPMREEDCCKTCL